MTDLLTIPPLELLRLWSDLVEAMHGVHQYGGNVAEIYVYRLQRRSPARELGASTTDEDLAAALVFHSLLSLFRQENPSVRINVNGREFGSWVAMTPNAHRWHVEITQ